MWRERESGGGGGGWGGGGERQHQDRTIPFQHDVRISPDLNRLSVLSRQDRSRTMFYPRSHDLVNRPYLVWLFSDMFINCAHSLLCTRVTYDPATLRLQFCCFFYCGQSNHFTSLILVKNFFKIK